MLKDLHNNNNNNNNNNFKPQSFYLLGWTKEYRRTLRIF